MPILSGYPESSIYFIDEDKVVSISSNTPYLNELWANQKLAREVGELLLESESGNCQSLGKRLIEQSKRGVLNE